ncbi:MAG: type II glyceraldehyde-3-phosphate dehydrogenase [Candidatus Aenigmarchaeota archaeon]|nr:type II glyceraldehyde-3-phosphate dehydrogenase [Candidatus Aenigmarchaeota archaeon]
MVNVCVNGYGTIGKRVAEAIAKHPKAKLVGISKYTPDQDAKLANASKLNVFVPKDSVKNFESKGISVNGSVDDMIARSDIVVDASADGKGMQNKQTVYQPRNKKAIFQGGEEAEIADISFNARSNFEKASGKQFVRVVSCNTTAYCRLLKPLIENYKIKHISAFLIRRGADLSDAKGSALNAIEWKAHSHHAHDIQTVLGNIPISSVAFKVPHTHSHINSMNIIFEDGIPNKGDLIDIYSKESRIAVLNTANTSAQIVEAARDLELPRNDTFVVSMLANTIEINEGGVFFSFSVPQESIVVPENIDALVSQSGIMSKEESMRLTDEIIKIPKIKSSLEKIFA